MALESPGVQVTIVDQSAYVPGIPSSTPLVIFATQSNKKNASGTGTAVGTLPENADQAWLITSQEDLVNKFGMPKFWSAPDGTALQGYELNEYGLFAAYSALGNGTQRIYCLRAGIDLAALEAKLSRPEGKVADGTYWLDTTTSVWGIYEWDSTTESFTLQAPFEVISDDSLIDQTTGLPFGYLGVPGDYAVYAASGKNNDGELYFPSFEPQFFYKGPTGAWTQLGTVDWLKAWPTIQGTEVPGALPAGETLNIDLGNGNEAAIEVRSTPGDNFLSVLVADINDLNWEYLSAAVVNGKLELYSSQTNINFDANPYITISGLPGETLLADLGLTAGTYYQPGFVYGTNAQNPLWGQAQDYPKPTGSVWIKVGSNGDGMETDISRWSQLIQSWQPQPVFFAESDTAATALIDPAGGEEILAGTIYGQYNFNGEFANGPVYYFRRIAEGPTIVTGTIANPTFTNGPYTATVQVSIPGSSSLSSAYVMTLADNSTAEDFVEAFNAATPLAVPFAVASITTDGAIQIQHTRGGEILLNDVITDDTDPNYGLSNGLFAEAGFAVNDPGIKFGPFVNITYQPVQTSTTGVGTGLQVSVTNVYQVYNVDPDNIIDGGSGYVVGDRVTFSGAQMGGVTGSNNLVVRVTGVSGGAVTSVTPDISCQPGFANNSYPYTLLLSNWYNFTYTVNQGAPTANPPDGTYWYWTPSPYAADIMVNYNNQWYGYKNLGYDKFGFPSTSIANVTDPKGPIMSFSEPTMQTDGTSLEYGDLWIFTGDLENYPLIFRWQEVNGEDKWVALSNTSPTAANGILFADARWATSGTVNPVDDPIPSIVSLLTSNYLDLDAPDATLSPSGILLFNTRRSSNNVKQYRTNYFNSVRFPDETLPNQKSAWVTVSGKTSKGNPYMNRKAQRNTVVQALNAAIATNKNIRDDDLFMNILACPNYTEVIPALIELNADRGETAFIVGDTPMRLPDDGTAIEAWATDKAKAGSTGEEGLTVRSEYMGLFYPSGLAALPGTGQLVMVPPSHMMIKTLLFNDSTAFPWFAPAGTTRGKIKNAVNIGYLNDVTNQFVPVKTRVTIRDVLYMNYINPLVNFTNVGLLNYGNKTSLKTMTAMDRINVSRLVNYLRRQLTIVLRPYVFEPNDGQTRNEVTSTVQTVFQNVQAKRGIYDYYVQCDEANNTPARIDANELWVDCAIEPVKAAEFIYVPVRIFNTGELASNAVGFNETDRAAIRNASTIR